MSERPAALLTGAARRLGATTARLLHDEGYDVAIHYHTSAADALALADELNAVRAGSALTIAQDLAAPDAAARIMAAYRGQRRRLDLLVNNASVFDRTPVAEITPEIWDRIHAINLRAPYFLALEATSLLRAARGSIVNITDIHAERPRAEYSAYGASKAALVAVTQALAIDLAPTVRVNAVSPGAILWASSEDAVVQADTLKGTPLGRNGEPADIAAAVLYLARAQFVTGHVLNVDGGRILHI